MTHVKVHNPMSKSFDGFVKDFFNDFPTAVGKSLREDVLHFPPVNIIDTPDSYEVELIAAGMSKEDFKVNLENNVLTISAQKQEEEKKEDEKVIRREFSKRSFSRSFTIDEKIESENISAKYENGVLHLSLPKREIAKAVKKDITIL